MTGTTGIGTTGTGPARTGPAGGGATGIGTTKTVTAGTWSGDALDLDAYLRRIGYTGELAVDSATLVALHRAHRAAIPYENLDVVLGRPVPLDVPALQDKLVRRGRGGYCFEQNLLFAAVLERIGFAVTGLGARIRTGAGASRLLPATHMVLSVAADGERWLCDLGVGAQGPLEPVRLTARGESAQGGWRFAVAREPGGVHVLRTVAPDGWTDLYGFTLDERFPADYEVANHYTSTHPRSPFRARAVVQWAGPDERVALVGDRLTVSCPEGPQSHRTVGTGELDDVLRVVFGVRLSPRDALALAAAHEAVREAAPEAAPRVSRP